MSSKSEGAKALFFHSKERQGKKQVFMRDGDDTEQSQRGTKASNGGGIPIGRRTENWYEEIEKKVEKNSKRSRKNENYLVRIDYRTVWIIRLLVAVMATVTGGVILQLIL